MTDYNTMTAQACADWLAERERWEPWNGGWRREISERREYEYRDDHPFALTLDAAAAALREPWRLVQLQVSGVSRVLAIIYRESPETWQHVSGPDRMTAEYRAAVAARMEDEQKPTFLDCLKDAHEAGGKAWDKIDDPDKYIAEMRGDSDEEEQ